MAETLLTPSSIKLFGRTIQAISFTNDTTPFAGNFFLQRQLAISYEVDFQGDTTQGKSIVKNVAPAASISPQPGGLTAGMDLKEAGVQNPVNLQSSTVITGVNLAAGADMIYIYPPAVVTAAGVNFTAKIYPKLARIYSFSFEGGYYALPRPPIFLVHGPGIPTGSWSNPSTVDQSGVAGREWDFSGNTGGGLAPDPNDLVYWEYEKGDFSLRLDLDAGPFEQILLQMALRGAAVSGAGVSGAGVSGAGVSGAGVSGAGVSGAGVSGAGVSGAGVSGAGVRR
jgi:hypothetical protein